MSTKNIWIPIGTAVAGLAIGIGGTYVVTSNAAAATPVPTITATVTATPSATPLVNTATDVGQVISSFANQVAGHTNINAQNMTSTITCPYVLGQPSGTTYECAISYSDGYKTSFKFTVKDGKFTIEGLK